LNSCTLEKLINRALSNSCKKFHHSLKLWRCLNQTGPLTPSLVLLSS